MSMSASVCLIGGSGFVGSAIVAALVESGLRISVATRQRERHKHLLVYPQVTLLQCNVHDPAALRALIQGHDAVISMVGILHGSAHEFVEAHVVLLQKIVQAMQASGVRRLVHISALGAALDGPSAYQRSKARGEDVVRASGLDWTILRPAVVFGRGDHLLNRFAGLLRCAPLLPIAGANTRFQPVWVEDVAQAVMACLRREQTLGQCFDLAGPEVYTLRELIAWVGHCTGYVRPIIALPYALAWLQAALFECLPGEPVLSRDNVRSLLRDNVSVQGFPVTQLGMTPSALTAVAPLYLTEQNPRGRYALFREHAGR